MSGKLDLSGFSVLVTDEHYKHTLGVVRHLGQMRAQVSIMAHSPDALACASRHCASIIRVREPGTAALIEAILCAVSNSKYNLLLPIGYKTTLALAQNRSAFLPYVPLEIADASQIQIASNKNSMAKLAGRLGVPIPHTCVPADLKEARAFASDLKFPIVAKPQVEAAGRSVVYLRDEKELIELCEACFSEGASGTDLPLLQEFIPGYGCGFFATYQDGNCKRVFMHRRVREYPADGGVSTCAQSFHHPKLEEFGRKLLDALSWHGIAMVEFRYDSRDGAFKLLEVNPKFWGSIDLALASGADFPGDLCRMAMGRELEFTNKYRRELRFQWPLSVSGDLYHLRSRPQSFMDVALDLLNPKVKCNIRLSDIKPNLRELRFLGSMLFNHKNG